MVNQDGVAVWTFASSSSTGNFSEAASAAGGELPSQRRKANGAGLATGACLRHIDATVGLTHARWARPTVLIRSGSALAGFLDPPLGAPGFNVREGCSRGFPGITIPTTGGSAQIQQRPANLLAVAATAAPRHRRPTPTPTRQSCPLECQIGQRDIALAEPEAWLWDPRRSGRRGPPPDWPPHPLSPALNKGR